MAREWPLPWYLLPVSRLGVAMLGVGLPLGAQRILTVNGHKSGVPRSVVVWPVVVGGDRYVLAGSGRSWVKNVEAARNVELSRGRKRESVRLVLVPTHDREPIIRAYWHRSISKSFLMEVFNLPRTGGLDDLLAVAPRLPVFRIDAASPSN